MIIEDIVYTIVGQYRVYDISSEMGSLRVGRRKEFRERIALPLAEGTLARIDARREVGEARLDVIRMAIEREIERRDEVARKANEETSDDQ